MKHTKHITKEKPMTLEKALDNRYQAGTVTILGEIAIGVGYTLQKKGGFYIPLLATIGGLSAIAYSTGLLIHTVNQSTNRWQAYQEQEAKKIQETIKAREKQTALKEIKELSESGIRRLNDKSAKQQTPDSSGTNEEMNFNEFKHIDPNKEMLTINGELIQ